MVNKTSLAALHLLLKILYSISKRLGHMGARPVHLTTMMTTFMRVAASEEQVGQVSCSFATQDTTKLLKSIETTKSNTQDMRSRPSRIE